MFTSPTVACIVTKMRCNTFEQTLAGACPDAVGFSVCFLHTQIKTNKMCRKVHGENVHDF